MGVFLALILVAWRPTLSYLTVVNTNRINHAEKLLSLMQDQITILTVEVNTLRREVTDWREKYIDMRKRYEEVVYHEH